MLKKLLERSLGKISDSEFAEILYFVTKDIKANKVGYGKRTSKAYVVGVASVCHNIIQRGLLNAV